MGVAPRHASSAPAAADRAAATACGTPSASASAASNAARVSKDGGSWEM